MKDKILDLIEYILLKIYFKIHKRRSVAFVNYEHQLERIMAEFYY
jgi:hypothetical protein